MTIGVISDSHGHRVLMHQVASTLMHAFSADWLYHLGDDFEDGEDLSRTGYPVRQTPGLWCPQYHDGRIPKRLMHDIEGVAVAAAHAEKDLRAVERAAGIVLLGHTHQAAIQRVGRTLYVNPGHTRGMVDRGERASFAVIEILPEEVRASIHEISGVERKVLVVPRARLG